MAAGKCASFWHVYIRDGPTACGVAVSQVPLYDKYILFIKTLAHDYGLDEDIVFQNVQVNAVRNVIKYEKDTPARKNAEKHIADTLNSNMSPTRKTIEFAMGLGAKPKHQRDPDAVVRDWKPPQIVLSGKAKSDISEKNRVFLSVLTSGQINIWNDYATRHNLDNAYAALSKVTATLNDL